LSTTDEQLVAKYQASRSTADLNELFNRYLGIVRNVAYRIVLCNATADDITQEVFLQVIRHAHTFRGKSRFSTWIYRITMNAAKAYLRRNSRIEQLPENDTDRTTQLSEQPDQKVVDDELSNEIMQALAKLTVKLRVAIVLTAIERLSVKEVAAIEDCSVATMHWRIHQARKQLKQLLQRYLDL